MERAHQDELNGVFFVLIWLFVVEKNESSHYVTWVISVMIEFIQGHPPCTSTFLVLSRLIRCHIKFLSLSDFIYAKLLFDLRHMALFTPIYDTL